VVRKFKACELSPRCAQDVPDDKRCEKGATCDSDVCVRPGIETIRDENQRNVCQELFFSVTKCRPSAKVNDPRQIDCANRAIAAWTVKNLNGDALDQEKAIIVASEVPLVDEERNPLKSAAGQPIVKRLAACDKRTGTKRENCRALFVEVSSCRIKPYDVAECAPPEAGGAGGAAGSAGSAAPAAPAEATGPLRTPACEDATKAAIASCTKDAITSWVDENKDDAKE
jgi:hypothetical protein